MRAPVAKRSPLVQEHASRPPPKPPHGGAAFDDISALTLMRPGPWREQLGKAPSFADAEPELARLILEGMTIGVDVGYTGPRKARLNVRNAQSTRDAHTAALITAIIKRDVAAHFKAGPFDDPPFDDFVVSPLGAVPKPHSKDGVRLIHNLSYPHHGDSINSRISKEAYVLARFDDACAAIRRASPAHPSLLFHAELLKFDIAAAFKQVPVRKQDRPLLGMKWQGKYYFELVLPFGLRTSGYRWEMYAKALHHFFLHHLDIELVIHYVDDFLLVARTRELGERYLADVLQLCAHLGVPLAPEKTEGPTHCLTFLGIEIDTIAMEMRLSASRLTELRQLLASWDDARPITRVELDSQVGKLQFATYVVRPGRAFLKRLRSLLLSLKEGEQQHGTQYTRRLTDAARDDIAWWRTFLDKWNGRSLLYDIQWTQAAQIEVFTDACDHGYGARFGNSWFQGRWTDRQLDAAFVNTRPSIPYLELHCLVHAAAVWGHLWKGKRITFRCDALAAQGAVTKRTAKRDNMADLIRLLTTISGVHGFEFQCIHIAGADNGFADFLSRRIPCTAQEYRELLPTADLQPTAAPAELQLLYNPSPQCHLRKRC